MKLSFLLAAAVTTTVSPSVVTKQRGSSLDSHSLKNEICLKQADFDNGTKIITTPGKYKLCENIVFNPNAPAPGELPHEGAFDPVFPGDYDENAFGLGFFSAIAIATSNVTLKLNGYTIEQHPAHALWQRFFAVIELADAPFIRSTGPAQFVGEGSDFEAASNIKILGPGMIGRSSHHGIHGNENSNVLIKKVKFRDFEVAAVSLNNVDDLRIENCEILHNRQDVPVLGLFSAARFILPYGKVLKEMGYEMKIGGTMTTAEEVYDNLNNAIKNVYSDVILGNGSIDKVAHPHEHHLFHNPPRTIDGPCYGFVVHGKGPAVGDHGFEFNDEDETTTSSNISIRNNIVENIKCWTNEVPAAVGDNSTGLYEAVTNDARGAVFQFVSSFNKEDPYLAINADGTYKGNVVADMQIMVASAIHDGTLIDMPQLQTGINTINPAQVAWAMDGTTVFKPLFRCNGDAMHHVNKGMIAIRVEDTAGFSIKNNEIRDIVNVSPPPFSNCFDYHAGNSPENESSQQACSVRGISIAAVRGFDGNVASRVSGNSILTCESQNAMAENGDRVIGVDIQGDSKSVKIVSNYVDLKRGVRQDTTDEYIALRCRENAGSMGSDAIVVRKNKLKQEMQILNIRRLRSVAKELPKGHMSGDIEWKNGGCPFAHAIGKFRREL